MEIQIVENVPIPPRFNKKITALTDTMRALKVGDSFAVPIQKRSSVLSSANLAGIRITTRKISDTEVRVWRIE